jgi:hypothetical protein
LKASCKQQVRICDSGSKRQTSRFPVTAWFIVTSSLKPTQ